MVQPKTRVALLGAGYIASWHADVLRRMADVDLAAVCDISENAAKGFAAGYGIANTFTSLDALLEANVADAVHVLTPPDHHLEPIEKLTNAGVPAFVEKPFCLSVNDCDYIRQLTDTKNVTVGVNHNFLMLPSYDRLKRDMAAGVIGPIDTIEVNWQFPLPPLRSGPFHLWMLQRPENLLFEIGSHLFAIVADLVGECEISNVEVRHPIETPIGLLYQSWSITGVAGDTAVTVNLSLIEGCENRSVHLRGLGADAHYNFGDDTYRLARTSMQDIVVGPLSSQISQGAQAIRDGVVNAARQLSSFNMLSPYGLSIARAIESFYGALRAGEAVDERLSIDVARGATAMIEEASTRSVMARMRKTRSEPARNNFNSSQNKTALVIGGTGFIGRALSDKLAQEGYDVRIYSRSAAAASMFRDGRRSCVKGSLKSKQDLIAAMSGVDCVFHLARATETTWQGYLENDVAVTKLIGECCIEAGVRRLIYTGTIDSYDASRADRPITEETPFDPNLEQRNLYARSKAACEDALKELAAASGLPLVIARPGIVIGRGGPLQHWGIAMWRGSTVCKLWGDGKNVMPFVLVDDVADGLVQIAQKPDIDGASYNLIGDPLMSAVDYLDAVGKANGVQMRVEATPVWRYFIVDMVKYWLKGVLLKRHGLSKPSLRDWKSRAQLSKFENHAAKQDLNWRPEANREAFIRRGVIDANLFGIGSVNGDPDDEKRSESATRDEPYVSTSSEQQTVETA